MAIVSSCYLEYLDCIHPPEIIELNALKWHMLVRSGALL